jgi:hypothetical protein
MKCRPSLIASLVLLGLSTHVHSAILHWDGGDDDIAGPGDGASAGGFGTWSTSISNWDQGDTLEHLPWSNATFDTAVFGGAPSASGSNSILLAMDITAGALQFKSAHFLDLNGFNLRLDGIGTTISGPATAATTVTIARTGADGSLVVADSQTWSNTNGMLLITAPVDTGDKLLTLSTGSNHLDVTGKISGSGGLTVNSS